MTKVVKRDVHVCQKLEFVEKLSISLTFKDEFRQENTRFLAGNFKGVENILKFHKNLYTMYLNRATLQICRILTNDLS